jgi:hypothetical protein
MIIAERITALFATFNAGVFVGWLVEKRKRDKDFAGMVANRLLGKQDTPFLNALRGDSDRGTHKGRKRHGKHR